MHDDITAAPKLSVIVPVYKEEDNIRPFLGRIRPVLEQIGSYEILFCLDPCTDRTEEIIVEESVRAPRIGLLVFSRRFGQPAATIAGIMNFRGAACVVLGLAVGVVEADHVDAGDEDAPEYGGIVGGRAESGENLGATGHRIGG